MAAQISPLAAFGENFTVDWKDNDSSDYDLNDDACDITSTGLGRCPLRAAIEQASFNNTINFGLGTSASNAAITTLSSALPITTVQMNKMFCLQIPHVVTVA